MSSITVFFIFIPLLAFILLAVNLVFAPHNPYQEKDSAFECGFHSFLGQNRTQFSISFFIFALLFLLFDLEILLVYPYIVSAYNNSIYGLIIMLIFFLVLTLGFAFELGKNALKINSRQMYSVYNKQLVIYDFVSSLIPVPVINKNLVSKLHCLLLTILNRAVNSLQWCLNSPPKPHSFTSLPSQSNILKDNPIFGYLLKVSLITFVGFIFRSLISHFFDINVFNQPNEITS